MSREIKFRAWDKETGKMHYQINEPRTDENIDDELIIQFDCTGYSARTKNKYIGSDCLRQSTGFVDKNGFKIYEGDVVHISGIGNYVVEDIRKDFDMLVNAIVEGDLNEIVGNIDKNPELITEEKWLKKLICYQKKKCVMIQ